MPTTVYFATNRVPAGSAADYRSYGAQIVSPSDPNAILYATAFVDNADLTADTTGAITTIQDIRTGDFSNNARNDIIGSEKNLLIFIHGFDNSFENAITRAAFNREWLAASGAGGTDTTVIAFTWPSLGQLIGFPLPWDDYRRDQMMAGESGFHLMSFFSRVQPIIAAARDTGRRVFLLAHSMGNFALQGAIQSWFNHGNGDALLFDQIILAAADEQYDSFSFPEPGRLSSLYRLSGRVSIYYSHDDAVLKVSELVNLGTQRLGQDGPRNRTDLTKFPATRYTMVDCTQDHDYGFDFASSHQYYRRSPAVRSHIAQTIGGAA